MQTVQREQSVPAPAATTGRVQVYHSTAPDLLVSEIKPFMHLGTLAAAQDRGKSWKQPAIYACELNVQRPLRCRDGQGAQHSVAGMLEWLESVLGLKYALVDELLMRCRADQARGIPASLAGGRAVASVLRRRGYDFLWYTNAIEDPGSTSWVVINPSHVKLMGRV